MRRRSDDEARAKMVKAGLEPLEPFAGTNKPWKLQSKEGIEMTNEEWEKKYRWFRALFATGIAVVGPSSALRWRTTRVKTFTACGV